MKLFRTVLVLLVMIVLLSCVAHAKLLYRTTDEYGRVFSVSYMGSNNVFHVPAYTFCLGGDLFTTGLFAMGNTVGGDIDFTSRSQGGETYLVCSIYKQTYRLVPDDSILYKLYFIALRHCRKL